MALFQFQTRNPNRDRETDRDRMERLDRMLGDLRAEMEREKDGLRDRYEKVAADAAFSQQALENDRVEASMSSKIDGMTDTMIRYRARIHSLEKQIGFVTELNSQVEAFSQENIGESLSVAIARSSRG
jgi:archaellum component FlaC